jgi:F420-non-reducing hydrogenase large subunit
MSRRITEHERADIESMAVSLVQFVERAVLLFEEKVLGNDDHARVIMGDTYRHETYYAGLVDAQGRPNFYDGQVRVVAPDGSTYAQFDPTDYLDHIAERVEPWSYLKLPYLKQVGWKGLTDGKESGVFRVNSLARLNVADAMATPKAQEAYQRFCSHFGNKPVHHTLAFHWARLIECLYTAEATLTLAKDPDVTSKDVRIVPEGKPEEGVGVVEAARGTLYHHYQTDSRGLVKAVNLIVATAQNNAAMNMSVKKAAQHLITGGQASDELLNRVEMAFRAYDPCLACATHALPGWMPLVVNLHQSGRLVQRLEQNLT